MDVGLNDFARRDAVMPEHRWNRLPRLLVALGLPVGLAAADATADEAKVDTHLSMVGTNFRVIGSIRPR